MRRLYFMAEDCIHCPPVSKAIFEFNRRNPFKQITVVDVDSPAFGMYEEMLSELEEKMNQPFGTPMIIWGKTVLVGVSGWKTILAQLEALNNKEDYYGKAG